ncbi:MAG: hypothetical protein K2L81_04595, partial [Muribaculaceae bacterium]|nr:hypothetical protein [Muribaculaceae bacterium]
MSKITLKVVLLLSILLSALHMQADDPVSWSGRVEMTSGNVGTIRLTAVPNDGFHFYAFPPEGGYNALQINITPQPGINITGTPTPSKAPEVIYDDALGSDLAQWSSKVRFTIPFEITDGQNHDIAIAISGQACRSEMCAMMRASLTVKATYDPAKGITEISSPASKAAPEPAPAPQPPTTSTTPAATPSTDNIDNPTVTVTIGDEESEDTVEEEVAAQPAVDVKALKAASLPQELTKGNPQWWEPSETTAAERTGLWMTLVLGFLGGLAALLTPCVWPMIPMTVSFFLKSSKG